MKLSLNATIAKRAAYTALVLGALLMVVAACTLSTSFLIALLASSPDTMLLSLWPNSLQSFSQASLTCGGWLLVFAGLLLAGGQITRSRTLDAFKQLLDEANSSEQGEATNQIAEAFNKLNPGGNLYAAARQYLSKLGNQKDRGKYAALNHARRRIEQFWFRAAKLVELGLLTEEELLDTFEPDSLEMLEPFETIANEDIRDLTTPKPWPAMRFYIAWLRRKGEHQKAAEWQATLPARPTLYAEYRAGSEKPGA